MGGSHIDLKCLKGGCIFWEGGVQSWRVTYRCLKGGIFWDTPHNHEKGVDHRREGWI